MIRISKKEISCSKYLICLVIMVLFTGYFFFQKIKRAITYNRTKGEVAYITYRSYSGKRKRTAYYPVVEYTVNKLQYKCYGSSFERDELQPHDSVTVLYAAADPSDGFVYNFLGYWAPPLTFVIPFSLVIILLFGIDVIPRRIYLKKPLAQNPAPLQNGLD